ncbi:MAG: PEP-CTERM sorting domain-containing protein, partial [Acidobacteriota bacterium]|nr:PEP-CTERM sorting domain-containing protein [Acidobacteriota bacterium]
MRAGFLGIAVIAAVAATAEAGTIQLLTNGGFETGDTSGWTASASPFGTPAGSCNNGFAASSSGAGCISGNSPVDGAYDAESSTSITGAPSTTAGWTNLLDQNFVAPAGVTSAVVTFDDTAACTGSGTFRGCDVGVDLYNGSTFLASYYTLTNPGSSVTEAWAPYSWDVTSILQSNAGQNLTFELISTAYYDSASGNSSSALNAAFDNVQVTAVTSSGAPEPGTWLLLVSGGALIGIGRFRRTGVPAALALIVCGNWCVPARAGTIYTVTDLGTLGGGSSYGQGINSSGEVAGSSYTVGNSAEHAFLWNGTSMLDLGTLGGATSSASAINNSGEVVGISYLPGNSSFHAFFWNGGLMQDLGT